MKSLLSLTIPSFEELQQRRQARQQSDTTSDENMHGDSQASVQQQEARVDMIIDLTADDEGVVDISHSPSSTHEYVGWTEEQDELLMRALGVIASRLLITMADAGPSSRRAATQDGDERGLTWYTIAKKQSQRGVCYDQKAYHKTVRSVVLFRRTEHSPSCV